MIAAVDIRCAIALLTSLCVGAVSPLPAAALDTPPPAKYPEYQPSSSCRICHEKQYAQHQESLHARSFSDPAFQAQYFKELLPAADANPDLGKEADRCIACHSPVSFQKKKGRAGPERAFDEQLSGVVCDFCHRVGAYKGAQPGGGNFMSSPGDMKFGPFKVAKSDWHHIYHELQTKSEFCAICHNDVNHLGLEIKSTFTEWLASPYAKRGIQCQDCHMSTQGFLTDGRPAFESGKATVMTVGSSVDRALLYSHRFPGTTARAQMEGALSLDLKIDQPAAAPGEEVTVRLEVMNRNAGHSIPTGSTDLRLLWLELSVETPGGSVLVPAGTAAPETPYDVAGRGESRRATARCGRSGREPRLPVDLRRRRGGADPGLLHRGAHRLRQPNQGRRNPLGAVHLPGPRRRPGTARFHRPCPLPPLPRIVRAGDWPSRRPRPNCSPRRESSWPSAPRPDPSSPLAPHFPCLITSRISHSLKSANRVSQTVTYLVVYMPTSESHPRTTALSPTLSARALAVSCTRNSSR